MTMINYLDNGAVAWTDWNVLLNDDGDLIMLVITVSRQYKANSNSSALMYSPSYYYIGHFKICQIRSKTNFLSACKEQFNIYVFY